MDLIRILLNRFTALFHRQKLDQDLDEELRSHIDLAVEENLGRGMSKKKRERQRCATSVESRRRKKTFECSGDCHFSR